MSKSTFASLRNPIGLKTELTPLSHPMRSETITNHNACLHTVSRASRQADVPTSSFDWFTGFSVSVAIGWIEFYDSKETIR